MPIYEFKCKECGNIFENIQNYTDSNPVCELDGHETEKLLSVTKLRRGAGLYSIDSPFRSMGKADIDKD